MKSFVRHAVPALLALLAGCATTGSPPAPPDSGNLAVRCGALIDGLANAPTGPATVLIRDGRVAAVEPGFADSAGLPVLDLSGHTCLPGLVDLHVHITEKDSDTADLSIYHRRSVAEAQAIARRNARTTLMAGFTSVRSVGNYIAWVDRDLRDEIAAGRTPGPRVQAACAYLTIAGGGGDTVVPGRPESDIPAIARVGVARGAEEFRRKAELLVAGGCDFLKVIASGAVLAYGGVPGAPEMTPEEIAAVAEVAHRHGLKLAAHAHGPRSIREAILAGADTIEHASLIDDEGIALARERGVALVMDVYNGDWIDTVGRQQNWPAEFLKNNVDTTEAQRQAFTKAVAVGAPVAFGSDASVFPHGLNARQFPIMVERGMTPMQAIQAATSVAARFMGWGDRVGALVPGRFGDLVAVRGDPLADISRLGEVEAVVKGGLVVKRPRP